MTGLNEQPKSSDRHLGIHQISLSKILASMLFNPFHIPYVCCYCSWCVCCILPGH